MHSCKYCYAERIRVRFNQPEKLSFHVKELYQIAKRKKSTTIFMGSMHDIFGKWVPDQWIEDILNTIGDCPQHTFIFLTKNPARYHAFCFPDNCWCGYTDDGTKDLRNWSCLKNLPNRFVSLEPLIGDKVNIDMSRIDQVIIGAMTGPGAIKPQRMWIDKIIKAAGDTPVFLKNNLLQLFPDLKKRRELSWRLYT